MPDQIRVNPSKSAAKMVLCAVGNNSIVLTSFRLELFQLLDRIAVFRVQFE